LERDRSGGPPQRRWAPAGACRLISGRDGGVPVEPRNPGRPQSAGRGAAGQGSVRPGMVVRLGLSSRQASGRPAQQVAARWRRRQSEVCHRRARDDAVPVNVRAQALVRARSRGRGGSGRQRNGSSVLMSQAVVPARTSSVTSHSNLAPHPGGEYYGQRQGRTNGSSVPAFHAIGARIRDVLIDRTVPGHTRAVAASPNGSAAVRTR
jgi:hypothetical protein